MREHAAQTRKGTMRRRGVLAICSLCLFFVWHGFLDATGNKKATTDVFGLGQKLTRILTVVDFSFSNDVGFLERVKWRPLTGSS
jgi:hypothetical protein